MQNSILLFLILSSNFGLNIYFVHWISCTCKTLFIVFSLTYTPKLSFNILTKEANVIFLSLNKTPSINPINFSFSFGFLPDPSRLFINALSSLYIFFFLYKADKDNPELDSLNALLCLIPYQKRFEFID